MTEKEFTYIVYNHLFDHYGGLPGSGSPDSIPVLPRCVDSYASAAYAAEGAQKWKTSHAGAYRLALETPILQS